MRTGIRRTTAAATAGLLLLTGTLPQASAQPSSTPAAARPNSVPPDLPPGTQPPADTGAPDVKYERTSKGCVESDTKSELIEYMPWGQVYLNLEQAHRFAKGKGIKIAIIDTGVDPRNPRFGGRVQGAGEYVFGNANGTDDCDGHGTEVAGVAAAAKTEGDFVGAAPEATILAIRQTSDRFEFKGDANNEKRASAGKVGTLAMAIVRAANQGARVINISLTNCSSPKGFSADDQKLQAAIRYAVDVKDAVIVTAAGNLSDQGTGCGAQNNNLDPTNVNSVSSPAWFADDVLSVGSIARSGDVSSFSVWGPWVSIAAPGEEIISVDPKGTGLTNANVTAQGVQDIKGTSFASPYVAGITALVRERFPNLKARQVMDRLKATALHPGNVSGKDNKVGFGMVNPVAALTAVLPGEAAGFTAAEPKVMSTNVTPPAGLDWPPIIVALSGIGVGGALLMLTLFIRNSLNRKRKQPA
ncbi:type VII secretion-associated serine protease mycosin [Lentzea sp. BCCO 10_0798]|jgi:membrane-anchored mycosin MYCP|uniref:Type VII secretion-associated serine protease mycosin n=1 Tax=Lentzea kristufekii TaxID=3095430 RepID=A0ABU4TV03_9PSEU|nr:type VII secretion-associated serine protease mycosin [Lentzea sp. BCCO 10_0798]MDX8052144.1 type VII secretion-associated serine protease mycosin [Lentzea sp. BCCO 10_0798]